MQGMLVFSALPLLWLLAVVIIILVLFYILSRESQTLGEFMILYREIPLGGKDVEEVFSSITRKMRMKGYLTRREGDKIIYEDLAFQWTIEKSSLDGEPSIAVRADIKGAFALVTIILLILIWIVGVLLAVYALIKFLGVRDTLREALAEVLGKRVYTIL